MFQSLEPYRVSLPVGEWRSKLAKVGEISGKGERVWAKRVREPL